jgi:hypothetical protein
LIENAVAMTKEMAGATDTVLGSAQANNTSAILALQEASRTSLRQVSSAYIQCLEDVAEIWADMLCAMHADGASLSLPDGEGGSLTVDLDALRGGLLHARVEVGNLTQYSTSATQNTLDRLLDGGHITLKQYLEQLPGGILPMRGRLLNEIEQSSKEERGGAEHDGGNESGDGQGANVRADVGADECQGKDGEDIGAGECLGEHDELPGAQ